MGIIKAAVGALGSTAADQWKEFFVCDSMDNDTLMVRAVRQQSERSANTESDPNVITDGSIIAVNEGTCAICVCGGKVTSVCKEPGENVFHSDQSPSVFQKGGIGKLGGVVAKKISFGGDMPVVSERIYFMNTKPIWANPFETRADIPIHLFDTRTGLDMDATLHCGGLYSFRITKPEIAYKTLIGNIEKTYNKAFLLRILKSEILTVLQSACSSVSAKGIDAYRLPELIPQIAETIRDTFNRIEEEKHGISLVDLSFSSFMLSDADRNTVVRLQRSKVYLDAQFAAAGLVDSMAEALPIAAENNGGKAGFLCTVPFGNTPFLSFSQEAEEEKPKDTTWQCPCGNSCTTKFCMECGKPNPNY